VQLDPTAVTAITLLFCMAVISAGLGLYLVFTNPPKDNSKFVGLRAQKMTDEEVAQYEQERANE
jgi:hypothetical protein